MIKNIFRSKETQQTLNENFFHACVNGDMNAVRELCKKFPPYKSINPLFTQFRKLAQKIFPRIDLHTDGNRYLLIACKKGQKEVVNFLVSQPNFIEKINQTDSLAIGLFFSIENNHHEIADILLPLIPRKNENYLNLAKCTFLRSCENGNLTPIKYLLQNKNLGINPNDLIHCTHSNYHDSLYVGEGFRLACKNGHLNVVKYLTSSPELTMHIDLEKIKTVVEVKNVEIMRHFILDLKIKKQDSFMFRINFDDHRVIDNIYKEVEALAMVEKLNLELPNKLTPTNVLKKIKV